MGKYLPLGLKIALYAGLGAVLAGGVAALRRRTLQRPLQQPMLPSQREKLRLL